ncbi:MAG: helix-turn-helix domain-containing protein [Actinomycetota bacterium]
MSSPSARVAPRRHRPSLVDCTNGIKVRQYLDGSSWSAYGRSDVSPTATKRRAAPPPREPSTLGEALRLLRHRASLSRDDLAAIAELSAGAVSNYENDVSAPSATALRRLTSALAAAAEQDVEVLWAQLGAVLDKTGETKTWRT